MVGSSVGFSKYMDGVQFIFEKTNKQTNKQKKKTTTLRKDPNNQVWKTKNTHTIKLYVP